jgi:hypothetical protein
MFPNTFGHGCTPRRCIAIKFVGTDQWVDLTAPRGAERDVVRITAADLRAAQRTTASIHADALKNSTDVAVFVDLDAMVADDARTALNQMNRHDALTGGPTHPDSLRYIGTPDGLAGLIDDIFRTRVADGVTVRPLSLATLDEFVDTTLPALARFGVTVGAARRTLLQACRRHYCDALPRCDAIPAAHSA